MPDTTRDVNDSSLEVFWQALRGGRPGPWASDHFEQSKHFTGVPYVVVDAIATWVASSNVRLVQRVEDSDSLAGSDRLERSTVRRAMSQAGAHESDEKWAPLDADHPAWKPFRQPNPQQTIADLLYEHTLQKCLTGTGLTWQVPNGYGEPCELYVLPQALTNALPPSPIYPNGAYRVLPMFTTGPFAVVPGYAAMGGTIIASEYIAVSRKWHPYVKYDGYSPLEAAGVQLDILQEIDNARWYAFQQGIDPSIYIELPNGTTVDQWKQLQAKLDENHSGTRNRKKPLALLGGAKANSLSNAPAEMGFETGWDQIVKFVCAVFRTPAVVAGLAQSASYAEWFAALKQFFTGTLIPICNSTAADWTLKIIQPAWGDDIRAQIDPPAIDDQEQLLARLGALQGGQALTKGELRTSLGFELFGDERDEEIAGAPDQSMNVNINGAGGGGDDDLFSQLMGGSEGDEDSFDRPENENGEGSLPARIAKALKGATRKPKRRDIVGEITRAVAAEIMKAGYTGIQEDSLGRRRKYVDGKLVPMGGDKHGGQNGTTSQASRNGQANGKAAATQEKPSASEPAATGIPAASEDDIRELAALVPPEEATAAKTIRKVYDRVRSAVYSKALDLAIRADEIAETILDTADDFSAMRASVYGDLDGWKQTTGVSWGFTMTLVKHAIAVGFKLAAKARGEGPAVPESNGRPVAEKSSLFEAILRAGDGNMEDPVAAILTAAIEAAFEALGADASGVASEVQAIVAEQAEDDLGDVERSELPPGRWVTINGTHVYVADGEVIRGPSGLRDREPEKKPEPKPASPSRSHENRKAPWDMTAAEAKAAGVSYFRTGQGSLYAHAHGQTIRVKTPHLGHETADVGLKRGSEATHFIDPEAAKDVGMWQSSSAEGKRIVVKDGHAHLVSKNAATGHYGLDKRIRLHAAPAAGLSPLELNDKSSRGGEQIHSSFAGAEVWKGNHPGSPITEFPDHDAAHEEMRTAAAKAGKLKPPSSGDPDADNRILDRPEMLAAGKTGYGTLGLAADSPVVHAYEAHAAFTGRPGSVGAAAVRAARDKATSAGKVDSFEYTHTADVPGTPADLVGTRVRQSKDKFGRWANTHIFPGPRMRKSGAWGGFEKSQSRASDGRFGHVAGQHKKPRNAAGKPLSRWAMMAAIQEPDEAAKIRGKLPPAEQATFDQILKDAKKRGDAKRQERRGARAEAIAAETDRVYRDNLVPMMQMGTARQADAVRGALIAVQLVTDKASAVAAIRKAKEQCKEADKAVRAEDRKRAAEIAENEAFANLSRSDRSILKRGIADTISQMREDARNVSFEDALSDIREGYRSSAVQRLREEFDSLVDAPGIAERLEEALPEDPTVTGMVEEFSGNMGPALDPGEDDIEKMRKKIVKAGYGDVEPKAGEDAWAYQERFSNDVEYAAQQEIARKADALIRERYGLPARTAGERPDASLGKSDFTGTSFGRYFITGREVTREEYLAFTKKGDGRAKEKAESPAKNPEKKADEAAKKRPDSDKKKPPATNNSKDDSAPDAPEKFEDQARKIVGGKLKRVKQRAWTGEATGEPISKDLAGAIGEEVVIQYLRSLGFADAGKTSDFVKTEMNNLPFDLIHDHQLIEVKGGQTGKPSGVWALKYDGRFTKETQAKLDRMKPEKRKAAVSRINAAKVQAIHDRKAAFVAKLSEDLGFEVAPGMMCCIINHEAKTADIYQFDGLHDRIAWNGEMANDGYVATVRYGR